MTRPRMGHDTSRLVENQTGSIFKEDLQRPRLPIHQQRRRLGTVEFDDVTRLDSLTRSGKLIVDPYPSGRNHALQGGTRQPWFSAYEKHIQAFWLLSG